MIQTVSSVASLPLPAFPHVGIRSRVSAQAAGVVVYYQAFESPLGEILLAGTEEGLLRLAFEIEDADEVLRLLERNIKAVVVPSPVKLSNARQQLDAYLSGKLKAFSAPLDMRLSKGFRFKVLTALMDVPYGETITYSRLAGKAQSPRAVRATASACSTNPLPIFIPCHRVVPAGGGPGNYLGGVHVKQALLALEAAR